MRALCLIGDPRAPELCAELVRTETGDYQDTPIRWARVGGPAIVESLIERLAVGELPAWREGIAAALGELGMIAAVEPLLAVMREGDDDLGAAADQALRRLFGVDPEDDEDPCEWWAAWWSSHVDEFDPRIRHWDGRPITIDRMLAGLEHPIVDDRDLAVEILILATGRHIAFDPRGYVEDQRAAIERWRVWARGNAERLVPGTWWR